MDFYIILHVLFYNKKIKIKFFNFYKKIKILNSNNKNNYYQKVMIMMDIFIQY